MLCNTWQTCGGGSTRRARRSRVRGVSRCDCRSLAVGDLLGKSDAEALLFVINAAAARSLMPLDVVEFLGCDYDPVPGLTFSRETAN